jgi:hypothetical protein
MEIDSRIRLHSRASGIFGLKWAEAMAIKEVETYDQGYMISNQIERFWILASIDDLSIKNACSAWKDLDKTTFTLPSVATKVGDELVDVITEYKLTYAEILSALVAARQTDLKYHLREERTPKRKPKPKPKPKPIE